MTIGNSVTRIGEYAFVECADLTSVTIGNSVAVIRYNAFWGCSGLTSVNFPNSLTSIGQYAFGGCTSLTELTIPPAVTSIGDNPFIGCSGLTSIVVESGNPYYDSRDNCNAIIKTATNTLVAGCKNTVIPNTVTCIGNYAFSGCKGLTNVIIPYSVTRICEGAFGYCDFTSVTIPNSEDLYWFDSPLYCFSSDRWDTLTIVGNGAWKDYVIPISIKTLNIGSGITKTDFGASNGVPLALDVINMHASTPPVVGQYVQLSSCYDGELHVPAGSEEAYSAAPIWENFTNLIADITDKVTLDRASVSLVQGGKVSLSATVLPEDGEVLWGTTNPLVATVDDSGTVTATGDGECDIFASLASNPAVYAYCHINVNCNETIVSEDGYLVYQVIDPENHEAALVGYYEALGADEANHFWGYQFPNEPVVIPSTVTKNGVEYTVTEIADNALMGLGHFSNQQRYEDFWPEIVLPESIRRIGKHALCTNGEASCTNVNLPHSLEELDDQCLLPGAGGGYILYENVNYIGKDVFTGMLSSVMFKNHDFEVNGNMCSIEDIGWIYFLGENLSIAPNTFNGINIGQKLEFGLYPCDIASNAFTGNSSINEVFVRSKEAYDIPDDAFTSGIYQNARLRVRRSAVESFKNASGWRNFVNIEGVYDGDVNCDGTVTSSDVTAIYDNLLDGNMDYFTTCDVNGDGYTTSSDVSQVYDIILNSEPSTPPIEILDVDSVQTYNVNGVSFKMIGVKGGTFVMGSNDDLYRTDSRPAHQVTLSSYYIGQTEVTQELWNVVMGNNPSKYTGNNYPVERVSLFDCQEFVQQLNNLTGENFKLPTEAEWEYAAMGGIKSHGYIFSGSNNIDDVAWYDDLYPSTNYNYTEKAVATKMPNELGIYDMSGNVYEWVSDRYQDYTTEQPQINPTGSETSLSRIKRGGYYLGVGPNNGKANGCSVKQRSRIQYFEGVEKDAGVVTSENTGFRLAKDVPAQ